MGKAGSGMVNTLKIASTPSSDLAPIGGQIERDFDRITDCIAAHLGPDAATIFSEPVSSRDGTRIDWYAARKSKVLALDQLGEEEQRQLLQRLDQTRGQIAALSKRLSTSVSPQDRALGKALHNAIQIPDKSYVYSLSGQPIMVAWGYRKARKKSYQGGLQKRSTVHVETPSGAMAAMVEPHAPKEDTAAAPGANWPPYIAVETSQRPERNHRNHRCVPWLLWLSLFCLVLVILSLLLPACAISFLPWTDHCNSNQSSRSEAALRLAALQREIAVLENGLALKTEQCPDGLGAADLVPSGRDIDNRLQDRSAGSGSLQVSLAWNGLEDLDLAVQCDTALIWYRNKIDCGGTLDTDSNNGHRSTATPVENIVWSTPESVPAGPLPIFVTYYSARGQAPREVPFTVRVTRRNGDTILSEYSIRGQASPGRLKQNIQVGLANQTQAQ